MSYLNIEKSKKIETIGEKYYRTINGSKSECTYEEAYIMTNDFFYTQSKPDMDYHYGAMYYGDLIKESAAKQQNFVTIDQEKQTYEYKVPGMVEGKIIAKLNYIVNDLGMLLSLDDTLSDINNPDIYARTTIEVTY